MRPFAIAGLLALLSAGVCVGACADDDLRDRSFVGLGKDEIRARLGSPDEVEELVKNQEHIAGPVEDLWYRLEPGGQIVIWTYETDTGTRELYFLNDSPEVAGEFFRHSDESLNPVF